MWRGPTRFRYANIDNGEFIEQYARMPEIESIADLQALTAEYQGVPLCNTVAVGDDGTTWYADTPATPNLSAVAEQAYIKELSTDPLTQIACDQSFVLPARCGRLGPRHGCTLIVDVGVPKRPDVPLDHSAWPWSLTPR